MNIGKTVGNFLGVDLTPGFNLTRKTPYEGAGFYVPGIEKTQSASPAKKATSVGSGGGGGGSGGGTNTQQQSTAVGSGSRVSGGSNGPSKQQVAQNAQLDQISRLLGILGTQEKEGISAIDKGYNSQKSRLTEQQTKAMSGYKDQFLKNDQDRQKGVNQVDDFAYNSYNALQNLLRGSNAGVSSVARQVVPQVVSKGAGTRRQGVFDTAGENTKQITVAQKDAEDQFRLGFEELGNQRNDQTKNLRQGIQQQAMDLEAQKLMLEADAGRATDGTSRSLDARAKTLMSLFGKYAPSYTAKAMNLKTPELGQFQVDPAAIRQDQGIAAENRAYLPGLEKRREREQA
jgi:hypothetical protein